MLAVGVVLGAGLVGFGPAHAVVGCSVSTPPGGGSAQCSYIAVQQQPARTIQATGITGGAYVFESCNGSGSAATVYAAPGSTFTWRFVGWGTCFVQLSSPGSASVSAA
jgi:hypothetical protein